MRLVDAKSSKISGAPEVLNINDPVVVKLYRVMMTAHPSDLSQSHPFWLHKPEAFRDRFIFALILEGLQSFGFRRHSFRSSTKTLERGTWATLRAARLYICDGLSTDMEMRLDEAQIRRLTLETKQVIAFVKAW